MLQNARQEKFAMAVAGGKSHKEAAIIAGYKETKYTHISANKLLQKKGVQERIDELKIQVEQELRNKYILSKEKLLETLGKIIVSEKAKDRDKIAGVQLAAKMQGFLSDDVNINLKKPLEEFTDEQLVAMLEKTVNTGDANKQSTNSSTGSH